jgi:peroxiredoxin
MSINKAGRLQPGRTTPGRTLTTVLGNLVSIPAPDQFTHLQFRRFAGCPVCDLLLHSLARRHDEIAAASIREVVIFHSSTAELLPFAADLPFAVIADPTKKLYAEFGVESAFRALFDPRSWIAIARGVWSSLVRTLGRKQPLPSLNPKGGRFGLPADFLIAADGRIVARKYGAHAYDQWSIDEILAQAASAGSVSLAGRPKSRV